MSRMTKRGNPTEESLLGNSSLISMSMPSRKSLVLRLTAAENCGYAARICLPSAVGPVGEASSAWRSVGEDGLALGGVVVATLDARPT